MAKKSFFSRLFPIENDFYQMIYHQAEVNAKGVLSLYNWLKNGSEEEQNALLEFAEHADADRMDMEARLTEAFSTPFDRADIYSVSVAMDKIMEYAKSTFFSMQKFGVKADDVITGMVEKLKNGTEKFAWSIASLKKNPKLAGGNISQLREVYLSIEQFYREGMAAVFKSNDAMLALKQREVYHHIKDASEKLDEAVDILHRIVVRLT